MSPCNAAMEGKMYADKCAVVCSQVLVRWGIQHGTSVIPKASSEPHLRSNLDVLNWELSKDDFKAISSIKFQVSTWSLSFNTILFSISYMHGSLFKHSPAVDSFVRNCEAVCSVLCFWQVDALCSGNDCEAAHPPYSGALS